jgi:hypothetical protein
MNRVETAVDAIRNMTNEELNEIVSEIKLRRTRLARLNTQRLAVGDPVEFTARGLTVRGTVEKINRKTVIVKEQGYGRWRVAASLLSAA